MKRARTPLPLVIIALTAAIVAVYSVELAGDGMGLCQRYGFVAADPTLGAAVSALFLHDPATIWHVGGNVVALTLFGAAVERASGHLRLLVLYVFGGISAAAFHVLANPDSLVPEVGASGPIFALMAAAAMFYPRLVGFVATYAALNIWQTVTGSGGEVATAAHVGGFTAGYLATRLAFGRTLAEVRGWRPARPHAARAVAA